jgi:hypothetical protein
LIDGDGDLDGASLGLGDDLDGDDLEVELVDVGASGDLDQTDIA